MNNIKYLTLFIFLLIPFLASAQVTEDDYFHATADLYIKGAKREAKKKMREAAERFPDSEKLKKLSSAVDKLPDEDEQQQQPQPQKPQPQQPQMSKENAQQILNALMQDEKETQEKLKKEMPKGRRNAEKDW